MALSDDNDSTSHLMNLPAELRLMIWDYVSNDVKYGHWVIRIWKLPDCDQEFPAHPLALLRVSRQAHAETRMLPYKLGTFFFSTFSANKFLICHKPEQISAMKKVKLIVFYSGFRARREVQCTHDTNVGLCSGFAGIQDLELIHYASQTVHKQSLVKVLMQLRDQVRQRIPGLKNLILSTALEGIEGVELQFEIEEAMDTPAS